MRASLPCPAECRLGTTAQLRPPSSIWPASRLQREEEKRAKLKEKRDWRTWSVKGAVHRDKSLSVEAPLQLLTYSCGVLNDGHSEGNCAGPGSGAALL